MAIKPQSILIYCFKNNNVFESVSHMITSSLGHTKFTINQLDESECWLQHCSLVVIASYPHDIAYRVNSQIRKFYQNGGKILSMGGYFTSLLPLDLTGEPPGPCLDEICRSVTWLSQGQGVQNSVVMLPVKLFSDKTVLCKTLQELGIMSQDVTIPEVQPLVVYSLNTSALNSFFVKLKTVCSTNINKELILPMPKNLNDNCVLIKKNANKNIGFFEGHQNSSFPEIYIHSKAVTSTQDLLWNNPTITSNCSSIAILSDTQISGKGRDKNQWISPLGSMCLSFYFSVQQNTIVGSKLPFVQYIAALATVQAAIEVCGPSLPVTIKWPNDIYSENNVKIGGVLVNCSTNNDKCNLCVGIGLNVNNSEPTTSLSKLSGNTISIDKMARKICDIFMDEVHKFNDLGHSQFVERFCDRWMHQDKKVKISVGSINCSAVIKSIDNDGYLKVLNLVTQEMISVQPDGNSFDMMENLIAVKSKI